MDRSGNRRSGLQGATPRTLSEHLRKRGPLDGRRGEEAVVTLELIRDYLDRLEGELSLERRGEFRLLESKAAAQAQLLNDRVNGEFGSWFSPALRQAD